MSKHFILLYLASFFVVRPSHISSFRSHLRQAGSLRQSTPLVPSHQSEERIVCTLFSVIHATSPGHPEIEPTLQECVTDDNIFMTFININYDYIGLDAFQSGKTKISVLRSALSKHGVIDMNVASPIIIPDNKRVVSSAKRTNFNFAVIRVSDAYGHSPDMTLAELSEKVFGTTDDSFSLVRRKHVDYVITS